MPPRSADPLQARSPLGDATCETPHAIDGTFVLVKFERSTEERRRSHRVACGCTAGGPGRRAKVSTATLSGAFRAARVRHAAWQGGHGQRLRVAQRAAGHSDPGGGGGLQGRRYAAFALMISRQCAVEAAIVRLGANQMAGKTELMDHIQKKLFPKVRRAPL